mmetsp:Transcript_58121/g.172907  ORF Transcript_58121/g.172907 Transcript_58121/m.172907 type:complete len:267 (+) Transcript_58121:266-1066(+)
MTSAQNSRAAWVWRPTCYCRCVRPPVHPPWRARFCWVSGRSSWLEPPPRCSLWPARWRRSISQQAALRRPSMRRGRRPRKLLAASRRSRHHPRWSSNRRAQSSPPERSPSQRLRPASCSQGLRSSLHPGRRRGCRRQRRWHIRRQHPGWHPHRNRRRDLRSRGPPVLVGGKTCLRCLQSPRIRPRSRTCRSSLSPQVAPEARPSCPVRWSCSRRAPVGRWTQPSSWNSCGMHARDQVWPWPGAPTPMPCACSSGLHDGGTRHLCGT